jgi:hypothetical protein
MIMLMEKEKEKAPSKRLKEKLHACIASFQASAVDVRRVGSSVGNMEAQAAAAIEPGTEADEYDIENLDNYSKSTLIRIIRLQHKRLQECSNEGNSWKSKYMRLKAEYRRATGKYWID